MNKGIGLLLTYPHITSYEALPRRPLEAYLRGAIVQYAVEAYIRLFRKPYIASRRRRGLTPYWPTALLPTQLRLDYRRYSTSSCARLCGSSCTPPHAATPDTKTRVTANRMVNLLFMLLLRLG
jgi:hypothetical protein